MPRSRKSRKPKAMSQTELTKAAELLYAAEQKNIEEGQIEVEAILKRRGLTMMPQIVHRGLDTIAQIIFLPKGPQTIQSSPLQVSKQPNEEESTE